MLNSQTIYVGFWLRLWASMVDTMVVLLITLPVLFAVYGQNYLLLSDDQLGLVDTFMTWIFPAIGVILCWYWRSATPGKMVISAHIVDAKTGRKASLSQSIIRYIAYFISLIPFGLGFLWIAWDDKKQGWHDKLAGTAVIRKCSSVKKVRRKFWISVIIVVGLISLAAWQGNDVFSRAIISASDQSLQHYSDEGFAFGQGVPSNLCWQEAKFRTEHQCHDLYCKYGQIYFLKACLVATMSEPPLPYEQ